MKRWHRGNVPKWQENQSLSQSLDSAKFWLYLWIECDRPRSGLVNSIRIATKKKFAKELQNHRKQITEQTAQKIKDNPHFLWSSFRPRIPKTPFSAADIPLSDWYSFYEAEFSPPDPQLEHKYVEELDQFLHAFPDSDCIVSAMSVAGAIMCLKPKQSRGIDGIHALHIKCGGPGLSDHINFITANDFYSRFGSVNILCGISFSYSKEKEKPSVNAHLSDP